MPCDGFELSGTHTVMTDKDGVSSLTVDAILSWTKTESPPVDKKKKGPKPPAPIFRDFGKDMEIGWNFDATVGAFNME